MTVAGSAEKMEICKQLGADVVVNYKTDDVDAAISEFAPDGLDLWWELLREPNFERTVGFLAKGGRMVIMAGRDALPSFPVGPFYVKDCSLYGFAMFNASAEKQQECAVDINRWLVEGKLKPQIDRIVPIEEIAECHQLQESNTIEKSGVLTGKIVLTF